MTNEERERLPAIGGRIREALELFEQLREFLPIVLEVLECLREMRPEAREQIASIVSKRVGRDDEERDRLRVTIEKMT